MKLAIDALQTMIFKDQTALTSAENFLRETQVNLDNRLEQVASLRRRIVALTSAVESLKTLDKKLP